MTRAGHIYSGDLTENRDLSLRSAELSTTRRRIEGTPQLSVASAACKGSGELENTFRSAGRS